MFEKIDGGNDAYNKSDKGFIILYIYRQKNTISRLQSECKEKDAQLRTLTLTSVRSYPEVSHNVRITRSKWVMTMYYCTVQ